jgi:GST-like protein
VKRWQEELAARPAVQRAMVVGANLSEDASKLSPEEQERRAKIMYNQRARPVPVA